MSAVEEARQSLHIAASLRFPRNRDEHGQRLAPQRRIEDLEDHYTACAIARGELEEHLLFVQAGVKELEDQWDGVEGWQALVTETSPTQKAIVAAKRQISPEIYDGVRSGKWLADKLRTQIRRLERDEEAASRLYSMLGAG